MNNQSAHDVHQIFLPSFLKVRCPVRGAEGSCAGQHIHGRRVHYHKTSRPSTPNNILPSSLQLSQLFHSGGDINLNI